MQGRVELGLVQQEGVVALIRLDLDEADVRGDGIECMNQPLRLAGGEEPVAGEGNDAEAGAGLTEGFGQHTTAACRQDEVVHRPGRSEERRVRDARYSGRRQ